MPCWTVNRSIAWVWVCCLSGKGGEKINSEALQDRDKIITMQWYVYTCTKAESTFQEEICEPELQKRLSFLFRVGSCWLLWCRCVSWGNNKQFLAKCSPLTVERDNDSFSRASTVFCSGSGTGNLARRVWKKNVHMFSLLLMAKCLFSLTWKETLYFIKTNTYEEPVIAIIHYYD